MIRLIFKETDVTENAGYGAPMTEEYRTFDVSLPEIEAWMQKSDLRPGNWVTRQFIGIERIAGELEKKEEQRNG